MVVHARPNDRMYGVTPSMNGVNLADPVHAQSQYSCGFAADSGTGVRGERGRPSTFLKLKKREGRGGKREEK